MLTHDRLDELVPIEPAAMEDRQVIEWDKDDIDALQFMKVDVPGARHAHLHEARPSISSPSTRASSSISRPSRPRTRAPTR